MRKHKTKKIAMSFLHIYGNLQMAQNFPTLFILRLFHPGFELSCDIFDIRESSLFVMTLPICHSLYLETYVWDKISKPYIMRNHTVFLAIY